MNKFVISEDQRGISLKIDGSEMMGPRTTIIADRDNGSIVAIVLNGKNQGEMVKNALNTSNRLYIVNWYDGGDCSLIGVFSSEARARSVANESWNRNVIPCVIDEIIS